MKRLIMDQCVCGSGQQRFELWVLDDGECCVAERTCGLDRVSIVVVAYKQVRLDAARLGALNALQQRFHPGIYLVAELIDTNLGDRIA
ncbi:hypothetical protein [Stenotrophomonas maltophilia]|uniref:hypothetical protein n=1 Tax=Stenotrophomonas maltophilia TaxID=40324 RepID=UPI0012B202B5|nr:hypothetical protein [Stenotrophomonas maltophilia]